MNTRYKVKLPSEYTQAEWEEISQKPFNDKDVLAQLYEAWHRLPPCELMAVIGGAIQELQYYRNIYEIRSTRL